MLERLEQELEKNLSLRMYVRLLANLDLELQRALVPPNDPDRQHLCYYSPGYIEARPIELIDGDMPPRHLETHSEKWDRFYGWYLKVGRDWLLKTIANKSYEP